MTEDDERPAPAAARTGFDWRQVASTTYTRIDWTKVAQSALGSAILAGLVGGALHIIGRSIEAEMRAEAARRAADDSSAADAFDATVDHERASDATAGDAYASDDGAHEVPTAGDPKIAEAAALLGVSVDASPEEIRAALRAALASSRLHPDHGGDGEAAKRLIAAKNLLVERARATRP